VIDHGRKIAEGTSRELKAQTGSGVLHVTPLRAEDVERAARVLGLAAGAPAHRSAEGGALAVPVADAVRANAALTALVAEGIEVGDFRMGQPSLEEVFFALTGGPGREARP
jgi:ABC-2 type transport system ATP-binding protein